MEFLLLLLAFSCNYLHVTSFLLSPCKYYGRPGLPSFLGQSLFSDDLSTLQNRIEEQTRARLVESLLGEGINLTPVELVGQAFIPASSPRQNRTTTCVVLSRETDASSKSSSTNQEQPCMLIPLDSNDARMKLLEYVVHRQPLSKTRMLQLNSLLVNRDGALFDNLPWSSWTVDPQERNRDAAKNAILARFHLGKRDAYNRFLGKDWKGNSLAIGNLALRLKYAIERDPELEQSLDRKEEKEEEEESQVTLARRILQLQIREQEMSIADIDYQIAICRQQLQVGDDSSSTALELERCLIQREQAEQEMENIRNRLQQLLGADKIALADSNLAASSSWIGRILEDLSVQSMDQDKNGMAPYRGATGYAPVLDTAQESLQVYTSPYDLLKEILKDQLNAEVIGAILENTSLLEGTLALGGAIALRRCTPVKSVTIAGERLTVNDEDEDFGNPGIKGGETILVECDTDEAIAMSLACDVPLRVETIIWERGSVMMFAENPPVDPTTAASVRDALTVWKTRDPLLTLLVEGQATNQSSTGRVSPLRIPRTTTSLFDALFQPQSSSSSTSRREQMFPTDNPVQSLEEYDRMTSEDKARKLMTMSNFEGRLPRPRVVRQSPDTLDKLLLPLIDESTRRQYLIRDATRRGDITQVQELEREKSRRQRAKENAENARQVGADVEAKRWDEEAEFYASLRADVTQDEGSYSRFLDRDEWYERTRAQQAKKLDKKKFGTLLDGLE